MKFSLIQVKFPRDLGLKSFIKASGLALIYSVLKQFPSWGSTLVGVKEAVISLVLWNLAPIRSCMHSFRARMPSSRSSWASFGILGIHLQPELPIVI